MRAKVLRVDLTAVVLGAGGCCAAAMFALRNHSSGRILAWLALSAGSALCGAYSVVLNARARKAHGRLEAEQAKAKERMARAERERSLERAERDPLWPRLDVAEERRARTALEHQARLLDNLHDAVIGVDDGLVITGWNAAAQRIYGRTREEVMGRSLSEILPPSYVKGYSHEEVAALARQAGKLTVEAHHQVGTERIDLEATFVPLLGSEGMPDGYVLLSRDITRRNRAEAALREAQRRMSRILETSDDGIWIVDARGCTEFANPRAAALFGLQVADVLGRTFAEVLPQSMRAAAQVDLEAIARGDSTRREMRLQRADGSVARLAFSRTALHDEAGAVSGAVAFLVDVTEQRRVEEELQQTTRLEAVGRLAAGIAHEINTPIQYIGDNTSFLKEAFVGLAAFVDGARPRGAGGPASAPDLEQLAEEVDLDYVMQHVPATLQRTLDGVERVATIVRAMKEFARQDDREMVPTDLNRALLVTLEVARNEYKYVADVTTELGPLPLVACHPGEINQVFLNLVVNAGHAIADANRESRKRGEIRIATSIDGEDVIIAISDTGTGVPEEIQSRIFDPFFTTKEVGRGSGQGLAIARSVVTKHGGQLGFTTVVGQGSTFRVRLPITQSG
jgi:PAS domain S-box-containing protein